jgi:ATP-binding cassette, subfamily B, bacterial PglK
MYMMKNFNLLYSMLTERQKRRFLWVVFAACMVGLLEALGVVAIFYFFSFISGAPSAHFNQVFLLFGITVSEIDAVIVGLSVLFIIIFKNGCILWSQWFQNAYISFVRHSLSIRLLKATLDRGYSYFLNKNTEILRARFLTDVDRVTDGYLRGFLAIVSEGLVAFCILFILIIQNPYGSISIIGGLGLIGFIVNFFLRKTSIKSSHELTTAHHKRYFIGGTMMSGIKDIKANCSDTFFYKFFSEASQKFSQVQILQNMILLTPRIIIETFAFMWLILGIIVVSNGDADFQDFLPTLALFGAAAFRLMPSLNRILSSLQQINFAVEPITEIHKMMFESTSFLDVPTPNTSIIFKKEIAFSNVSYSYPEALSLSLKNISFNIKKNEFVGIVGSSGAGKSTLIDIILGLLHPCEGKLKIDDETIEESNSQNWRSHIGYVPQNIFLLDDTLARNIAFGRTEIVDMNEVRRVSELAQVDQFIDDMPDGFETRVGENGVRLSGGQRQRIGIARALYGGADILLFDEATSALDNETEREVTKSILSLVGKITMVVVAHRLSTVEFADKLLLLDKGELSDIGTFEELMLSSEVFRRISLVTKSG